MPVKLGYKSIDESGGGKAISGKGVIDRLRSMKIFSKKEGNDLPKKQEQPNSDDASTSETTAELSPVKGDHDSYDDKFDLYFASSYLPHMPVANKEDLDKLEAKPSIHFKAFAEASEMEVPPAPPQKARTRLQSSRKAESGSVLRPTNLSNAFAKNIKKERQSKTINRTKEHLRYIGNELIEAVEHSQADFNLIIKRMSSEKKPMNLKNPFTEKQDPPASLAIEPKATENVVEAPQEATPEPAHKKTTVPKTMGDIKEYLSQLRASTSTTKPCENEEEKNKKYQEDLYKKYHQIIKSKMGSFAKTLSSVAPDVAQASSNCETNICNFMEVAEELINPTLDQSGYFSSTTPLNQSWFEVDDDSDSVSKLTMPLHFSELSVSALSEYAPGDEEPDPDTEVPAPRLPVVDCDF